ncbi:hypothetical protein Bbelb_214820 [Branchiostoma belcheri]|nr:hypothetical protein Bbelb_214820 [Branchiostoma belcheri]
MTNERYSKPPDHLLKTLASTQPREEPFVMKRENKDGTYKYSGFCIDILNELAKNLGFTYQLYEVPDHKFGAPEGNGSHWNGMVGEVMYNRADIAIGPLTISAIRERVVDFTHPFMDHGVGMVSKKPEPKGSGIFGFLLPFDSSVWFSILGALIGVALLLFITSKIRHKMRAGDVNYDNDEKFDLKNSLWLTYWSIVRKGGEPAPRSLPSRILTGAWWLFTLIVISTYTANLTAFLTVKRLVAPINSVEDLVSSSVPYGCVKDAFLYSFFRAQANLNGSSSVWGRMWHAMTAYDEFPYSPTNGIEIVKRGQFVFIQETPFLEFVIKKDPKCELMMLGKPFLYKGYGFPILKMQESGLIDQIKTKWWSKDGCPLDGEIANVNEVTALGIETFLGVFYVLLGASALALLVTIGQIIHKKLTKKKRPRMIKLEELQSASTVRLTRRPHLLAKDAAAAIGSSRTSPLTSDPYRIGNELQQSTFAMIIPFLNLTAVLEHSHIRGVSGQRDWSSLAQ